MREPMRVAVVGSRDFPDLAAVHAFVRSLPHDVELVSGGAAGVDQAAETAARARRMSRRILEPDVLPGASWRDYARACYARNEQIAEWCDRMVAFRAPRGAKSNGTDHAIAMARKHGKPVEVRYP